MKSHQSALRSILQFFHFSLLNFRFNLRVYWKLLCIGKSIPDLHLLYNELVHFDVDGPLPFLYSLRGRIYFIINGKLLPEYTALDSYSKFKKLTANKKWPIGKAIGKAATAAGDHPLMALKGRGKVKGLAGHPKLLSQLDSITQTLKSKLHDLADRGGANVALYREVVRCTMAANFEALFEANFQEALSKQVQETTKHIAMDYLDRLEGIANSTSHESLGKEALETSKTLKKVIADIVQDSPVGTFGGGLMSLYQDGEFSLEMLHDNALFYAIALGVMPAIHLHWFVLTLIRNPGHLERIREGLARGDRTYLRMCQKEVLRLFPPVSAYAPRKTKEQIRLGKYSVIPKHSLIVAFPVLMIDDQTFDPERWRNDQDLISSICEEGKPFYAPFSSGVRVCVARHLVSNFFEDMMASILQDFDFQLTDDDPWVGKPSVLSHYPRNQIGFRPAEDLSFSVSRRPVVRQNLQKHRLTKKNNPNFLRKRTGTYHANRTAMFQTSVDYSRGSLRTM